MAGEVIVDALPYIDQGYDDPGVREAVSSKIYIRIKSQTTNNAFRHLLWWKRNADATDPQRII